MIKNVWIYKKSKKSISRTIFKKQLLTKISIQCIHIICLYLKLMHITGKRWKSKDIGYNMWKILTEHKDEDFLHEGSETPRQVAQRGCGASILGNTQNSTCQDPRKPDVIWHAVNWRWFCGGFLQPVSFCDLHMNL